jgi:hypothetical protein
MSEAEWKEQETVGRCQVIVLEDDTNGHSVKANGHSNGHSANGQSNGHATNGSKTASLFEIQNTLDDTVVIEENGLGDSIVSCFDKNRMIY